MHNTRHAFLVAYLAESQNSVKGISIGVYMYACVCACVYASEFIYTCVECPEGSSVMLHP